MFGTNARETALVIDRIEIHYLSKGFMQIGSNVTTKCAVFRGQKKIISIAWDDFIERIETT